MPVQRLRFHIYGAVQGVGFRPFVFRLASELRLNGWVGNNAQGVVIDVEGEPDALSDFQHRLISEKPPRAAIHGMEAATLDPIGYASFEIRHSVATGATSAIILPDIAMCDDCRRELSDPSDCRYRYPFINCTNCGPRFSIITSLPYDRPNTTMAGFMMCRRCRKEYENPADRRFHAQPIACPDCGPHLEFWDADGKRLSERNEALRQAAGAIREGAVVAVKGLGGFHLMVDARNDDAIAELRRRKHREEKPLALMFPTLEMVKECCEVSPAEQRLLESPEAPIVLLHRSGGESGPQSKIQNPKSKIGALVAPDNPYLGVMLPYTPLHYLLLSDLGFPVVATSGNLSEEPICTGEREAMTRLNGVADLFLVHNRPIARHVDDSIARIVLDREMILRRARGYAPLPIHQSRSVSDCIAVGGHLKNSVAIAKDNSVFISQHIGDLETAESFHAFERVIGDLSDMYQLHPIAIACDRHPDYLSTQYAHRQQPPVFPVQHHLAHVLSCAAENEVTGEFLGVAWDGTGYGDDGTIWGGEFLKVKLPDDKIGAMEYRRVAHLLQFPLPGGDAAVREPRRSALGLLYELFGDSLLEYRDLPTFGAFREDELELLLQMLRRGVNCPLTSSIGRLFDAIASLIGLRQVSHYEGQAAMALEFAAMRTSTDDAGYPVAIPAEEKIEQEMRPLIIDYSPMVAAVINDLRNGVTIPVTARRFHNSLAQMIVMVAQRARLNRVVMSGGCFQNALLLESAVNRLRAAGFAPYWHQRIPTNDGGISLGQIVALSYSATQNS